MQLRNCICFSQKGLRDLPSKLSGGDLDGDKYHIIFDANAKPQPAFQPADYVKQAPRELDRPVDRRDMTDFFVTFMETDQLGRICNIHKMLADQSDEGVRDPRCIKLAEMASTAVDFSKTGIPVGPMIWTPFSCTLRICIGQYERYAQVQFVSSTFYGARSARGDPKRQAHLLRRGQIKK